MFESLLEGGRIWSLVSVVAGLSALVLGLYVVKKNPFMKISMFFFRLMMIAFTLGFLDFFLMNAPDELTARILARAIFFLMVLMFGGYLYIAASLPYGRAFGRLHAHPIPYWGSVIAIALMPALAVDEMLRTQYGWGVPISPAMYLLVLIILGFVLASIIMLSKSSRISNSPEVRWQALLMALAVSAPLVYGLCQEALDHMGIIDNIPILSPGFIISNIIIACGIMRFNMFIISPVHEEVLQERTPSDKVLEIPRHSIVLLEEKRVEVAYSLFIEELNRGYQGLLISRTHPDAIRQMYGLMKTPIIWLANKAGVNNVSPSNLSILQHTIMEFTRKTERAVIMIEGLEYLLSSNSVEKILKLLYALRDEAADTETVVLVPIDPDALELRHLALFERECEVLRSTDLKKMNEKGRDRDLNSSQGIHSPTG